MKLQFSLRTLLIGVTLLAIPCSYVGWQAKIVRSRKAILTRLTGTGGAYCVPAEDGIPFPDDIYGNRWAMKGDTVLKVGSPERAPVGLRKLLGDQTVRAIWLSSEITGVEAEAVGDLFPESRINR